MEVGDVVLLAQLLLAVLLTLMNTTFRFKEVLLEIMHLSWR